ncbi:MAG: Maf family protein [Acholeplasmatales bacterium]|jgi:septum formation protein|nr:Maf family protein [Acholeplasmatales bacterium]
MLILGSNSQGRRALLEQITQDFLVAPSNFDEDELKHKQHKPSSLVQALSLGKLKVLIEKYPQDTIICADTIVYQKGVIYGKPTSREDAYTMLLQLSLAPHYVYSGASVYYQKKIFTFYEKAKVIFKKLSPLEIQQYLDRGEYWGKAGSYGIQSLSDGFVKKVEGNYATVIGLPLEKIQKLIFSE